MDSEKGSLMKAELLLVAVLTGGLLSACQEPNAPRPPPVSEKAPQLPDAAAAKQETPKPDAAKADSSNTMVPEGIDVAAASEQTYCNIESVGDTAFSAGPLAVEPGQQIRGWLGHSVAGDLQSPLLVFLDESGAAAGVRLKFSISRDDVANAYGGRSDLRNAGFEDVVPAIAPGTYKVLLHYTFGGAAYRCDNGRQVTVR